MLLFPRWKKWLFTAIKLVILGLMAWFLRATLVSAFEKLRGQTFHLQPTWLALAAICYVAGLTPVGVYWHQLLRSTGQDVGLFEAVRSWWVGQIFKYVPGKAMVLVVRVGLLRSKKIETTVVTATVFAEALTMMAVGSLISFVVLMWAQGGELASLWGGVHSFDDLWGLFKHNSVVTVAAAFAMFVGTGLPTWPPMMQFLIKILGVGKLNPTAASKLGAVPYRVILLGWLMIACGWFVQGIGLWATLRSLGVEASLRDLPMNTAAAAMSTVAGFLSFIPGGALVREYVQTELMAPDYGEGTALVVSLIWRLVMLVSEAVVSSILYLTGPRRLRHKIGGPADSPPT